MFVGSCGVGNKILNAECARCHTNMVPTTDPNFYKLRNMGYCEKGEIK